MEFDYTRDPIKRTEEQNDWRTKRKAHIYEGKLRAYFNPGV